MSPEVERPEHDDELCRTREVQCFKCHIGSVGVGLPRDFRSRTRRGKARTPNASYEAGIPTSRRPDGSEMPYLRADGETMRQVEFNRKAHQIEDNRAKLEASSRATTTT